MDSDSETVGDDEDQQKIFWWFHWIDRWTFSRIQKENFLKNDLHVRSLCHTTVQKKIKKKRNLKKLSSCNSTVPAKKWLSTEATWRIEVKKSRDFRNVIHLHDFQGTFTFKSRRRAQSPLSVAFYIRGSREMIVNQCCEFGYSQIKNDSNQSNRFSCHSVYKFNPCQKFVLRYWERNADSLLYSLDVNKSLSKRIAKKKWRKQLFNTLVDKN